MNDTPLSRSVKETASIEQRGGAMADALTRWHPFADLADLRTRFDRLFDEMASGERRWAPTVDLVEEDDKLVVRADVPGIKRKAA
jgi:HSP20 family molecular chaperone IbpA